MKLYKIILIILALGGVYLLGGKLNKQIEYKYQEVILDNLTAKINELKGKLVSDLKQCESGGVSEDTALITFDPHPTKKNVQIASLGNYQFKVSTIQFYYNKFYSQDLTNKEAVLIALDDEKAGKLASDIIFRDGSLGNWYNCSKKMGLENQLKIIRELEK